MKPGNQFTMGLKDSHCHLSTTKRKKNILISLVQFISTKIKETHVLYQLHRNVVAFAKRPIAPKDWVPYFWGLFIVYFNQIESWKRFGRGVSKGPGADVGRIKMR